MLKMAWPLVCYFLLFVALLVIALGGSETHARTAARVLDSALDLTASKDEGAMRRSSPQRSDPPHRVKRYVSPFEAKRVAARQGWKCGACKQTLDATYEIDHVTPLFRGGTNDSSNLQALCRSCHISKSAGEAARR